MLLLSVWCQLQAGPAQLANEVGADAWFSMPHQADDAYVAAFAEYVRDHVKRALDTLLDSFTEVE